MPAVVLSFVVELTWQQRGRKEEGSSTTRLSVKPWRYMDSKGEIHPSEYGSQIFGPYLGLYLISLNTLLGILVYGSITCFSISAEIFLYTLVHNQTYCNCAMASKVVQFGSDH